MPIPRKTDWEYLTVIILLSIFFAVFWTAAAYGISHLFGAPFLPWALGTIFIVTGFLALLIFALLKAGRDN